VVLRRAAAALAVPVLLAACSPQAAPSEASSDAPSGAAPERTRTSTPAPDRPAQAESPAPAGPRTSDGSPRRALLTIPDLGITALPVVPYEGWTDDAPGTAIQDRGLAAAPHGPRGGTGPGGVGNYQVTAHRLSSTQAFLDLPDLDRGDVVHVDVGRAGAGGTRYTYRVVDTRRTSFRSPASLRAQRAAVPGRPGAEPVRAMITLSTCATPEDRAAGNFWTDEFGNPEHRIDKIGVLVRARTLGG